MSSLPDKSSFMGPRRRPLYVVLLHYPMENRAGETVATAVTNLDIHDIARTSRTYGVVNYFIVTPVESQHEIVGRILSYWKRSANEEYHPNRSSAVSLVTLAKTFDSVLQTVRAKHTGTEPEVILTDARESVASSLKSISYSELRDELYLGGRDGSYAPDSPVILVFGTGWGTASCFYPVVSRVLVPIYGLRTNLSDEEYNHLSVRSAVAIILDRLTHARS